MSHVESLSILQYNVRRSKDIVMATLLRHPKIMDFNILAVQEPWANSFVDTTHHSAKERFHLCYPRSEGESPAMVGLFINKRLDHFKWRCEPHNPHLCTITIALGQGQACQQINVIK
jgi:hypothetical protein